MPPGYIIAWACDPIEIQAAGKPEKKADLDEL